MAPSVDQRLDSLPRKPAEMSLRPTAKPLSKPLRAPLDPQAVLLAARVITDMLRHGNVSPKEASYEMGHADQSQIARWQSGQELPAMFVRIIASPALRRGLVVALAELPGDDIEARVVIEVPQRKAVSA